MQNRHIAMGILLLSLLLSSWLYWGSDFKLEQVLTSREWQSKMVSLILRPTATARLWGHSVG